MESFLRDGNRYVLTVVQIPGYHYRAVPQDVADYIHAQTPADQQRVLELVGIRGWDEQLSIAQGRVAELQTKLVVAQAKLRGRDSAANVLEGEIGTYRAVMTDMIEKASAVVGKVTIDDIPKKLAVLVQERADLERRLEVAEVAVSELEKRPAKLAESYAEYPEVDRFPGVPGTPEGQGSWIARKIGDEAFVPLRAVEQWKARSDLWERNSNELRAERDRLNRRVDELEALEKLTEGPPPGVLFVMDLALRVRDLERRAEQRRVYGGKLEGKDIEYGSVTAEVSR